MRLLAAALAVAAVLAGAALPAACGGSSGAASPSASPAPAVPGSRPFPGSPREAVAAYWALVDAGDSAGLSAACTPGSAAALTSAAHEIAHARLIRVARVRRYVGGAQVQADVRIEPSSETTPWGEPGTHTLFIELSESGGGWLVSSWATSP